MRSIVLAIIFIVGGSLRSVVLFQYLAWAILMIAVAATSQVVTRSAYSLGAIILLAMYPGLLIYRNLILSETLYMFFLNMVRTCFVCQSISIEIGCNDCRRR